MPSLNIETMFIMMEKSVLQEYPLSNSASYAKWNNYHFNQKNLKQELQTWLGT